MSGTSGVNRLSRPRWAAARLLALERDDWKCQRCGRRGRMEVHHKVALADGGEPYELSNLETLCRSCHIEQERTGKTDHYRGRREWSDRIDRWR